jgi:hypothetical protein
MIMERVTAFKPLTCQEVIVPEHHFWLSGLVDEPPSALSGFTGRLARLIATLPGKTPLFTNTLSSVIRPDFHSARPVMIQ